MIYALRHHCKAYLLKTICIEHFLFNKLAVISLLGIFWLIFAPLLQILSGAKLSIILFTEVP